MWLTRLSINNPVMACMMMLALLVLGLFSYQRLTVEEFPDVKFPIALVNTPYPGATPEAVETEVSRKIEEGMNTLSGIKRVTSRSYQGLSLVIVEFELSVDIEHALADVRDKLTQVRPTLRDEVKQSSISRFGPDDRPVASVSLVSDRHTPRELTERADRLVIKRLQTVRGVGRAALVGGIAREIQIRLDPLRMRALSVGVEQIADALRGENQLLPAGALKNARQEMIVQVQGRLTDPRTFGDIVVAQRGDSAIRMRDVATIVDGEAEPTSIALINGHTALSIDIYKVSDANTVETVDGVRQTLAELNHELPDGMNLDLVYDGSVGIRNSLSDVQHTLLEGALLTVLIVFIFLGSWRSTVITGLTLPLSLLGSVFMIHALGFSLNLMTLLSLSLCVGLLIDDAIVVRENIVRHALRGKSPRDSALDGTQEIGLAVLATTLTIVAVFLPVGFMGGVIGRYFYQFGLTVSSAVLLSMFVSFTLDPMLSSVWHDPHTHGGNRPGRLGRWLDAFERGLDRVAETYGRLIAWALGHRLKVLGIALLALVGAFALVPFLGSEFVPKGDFGDLSGRMTTPVGSSLAYSTGKAQEIAAALKEFPEVKRSYITISAGYAQGSEQLALTLKLVPRAQRHASQDEMARRLRARLTQIGGLDIKSLSVGGDEASGGGKPVYVSLQGPDLEVLSRYAQQLATQFRAIKGTTDVETSVDEARPTLDIAVNRPAAADLGLSVERIGAALRPFIEGQAATTWQAPDGETYDVRLRLPPELRRTGYDLDLLWLASSKRTPEGLPYMIPISQVAKVVPATAPTRINRRNLAREVSITADVSGRSAGDVGQDINKVLADLRLPPGYRVEIAGANKDMAESFGYAVSALMLAVIFIYMILASQFGSFLHPLAIMTSLPLSLIGVFLGLLIAGSTLNIFSIIGIIMLMGLVTKNAILLVDFIEHAQKQGQPRLQAIIDAGRIRLRPILMTTFAMIFGMLPVALGLGEGGEQRAPMAHSVIGGVITSTLLTLIVVPVVYTYLDDFGAWAMRKLGREKPVAG